MNEGDQLRHSDDHRKQIDELRDRISRLSAASVRISASLDLGTVLREVVDSARSLTGARYGLITTTGDEGQVQDFVTSGFTPEEQRQFADWPDGPRLFAHFRDLPGALRLRDLPEYVRSLGFSATLMRSKTFQVTPMRHRGVHVGNFFLGGKESGPEFTSDDEEILLLFASQAATAVANARTHRDEKRARADLEALMDTSPVGVVVFDARTARPVKINREARRIVEGLRTPGRSPEQALEVLTWRRADGSEISLAEIPLAQELSSATNVRAEEIILQVPEGQSVTTLVNCTPICSDDGAVESVVITMQDLAPLQELERLRAEFLGMVSHELRAPLTSIKGSAATALGASPSLSQAEVLPLFRIINEQADHMRCLISDLLDAGRIEAGTLSVDPQPTEVVDLVEQARKTFRTGGGRNTLQIDLPPDLPRVLADRGRIVQVLNNLFSNASRHSPDSSPIRVDALHDGTHVAVAVSDDGRGVPPEVLPQLFRKHARVGGDRELGIRGSGLGLAICKGLVEAHGGRIRADSDGAGVGMRFTFTLPVAEESAAAISPSLARPLQGAHGHTRVLVVDDDPQTLRYVQDALTPAGYVPILTGDSSEVQHLVKTEQPQLVLLDLLLPGTDGIELMENIPELTDLPVIFISAYGRDETIARALEKGAADYIVKPFSPTELVARVRAALRRQDSQPQPFVLKELAINYEERRVTLSGSAVELTAKEYELLRELSVNAGRVTTYETLLRRVWKGRETADLRVVRAFVKKLRQKLGDDASCPAYIITERQVGYRMARPVDG